MEGGDQYPVELSASVSGLSLPLHPGHVCGQSRGQVTSQWDSPTNSQSSQTEMSLNQGKNKKI